MRKPRRNTDTERHHSWGNVEILERRAATKCDEVMREVLLQWGIYTMLVDDRLEVG